MSLLGQLKPKAGSRHRKRRIGRGNGSGWGGTAGKGHKGQKARSGAPIPRRFEGGQTPLARRLPKFGFNNKRFANRYAVLGLRDLNRLGGEINPESLRAKGLIGDLPLKIIATGEISKKVSVRAHRVTPGAQKAIEASGGSVELISTQKKTAEQHS